MPDSRCERELREKLLLRTRDDVGAMRSALVSHHFPLIVQKAHRLAGAAGALGLDALGDLGRALENEAAVGDASAVRTSLEALSRQLELALAQRAA